MPNVERGQLTPALGPARQDQAAGVETSRLQYHKVGVARNQGGDVLIRDSVVPELALIVET